MPTLSEAMVNSSNFKIRDPIESAGTFKAPIAEPSQPISINTFQRCPLPPIYSTNVDSVRQFFVSGKVPQFRIYARSLT